MPFINRNALFFLFLLIIQITTAPVFAQEKEAEKPSAEAGDADREWAKRTSRLNVLDAKMRDANKKIQSMILVKNSGQVYLDEKGKPQDVLAELVKQHKVLSESEAEYRKESAALKYRFPEEGELIERKYVPLRVQTLEQIEREIGLDGELTRTKEKIDKKYATFVGDDLEKQKIQKVIEPTSTLKKTKTQKDEPTRLKLSK